MMTQRWFVLGFALLAGLLAGCVERRYVVVTDPPGAVVFKNGDPLGAAPADGGFLYYGKYNFTLVKDGYETMEVEQKIAAPWFEYPPLDFVSENLIPWKIKDIRRFNYQLEPRHIANTDDLLRDAQNLRNRGLSIPNCAPPAPAAGPVPVVPPPGAPVPQPIVGSPPPPG
jgi:hypothetical protein